MAKARAIVWRHRWELAPLLLFVFTGGLQTLLLALHSTIPFGFRRIFGLGPGVYIASEVDLYWLVFNLAEFLLLRWGLRRVKRLERPVTEAIWIALLFSPVASLVAGSARRVYKYFEAPAYRGGAFWDSNYEYVITLIACAILMVGIAQAMRVLRGSPAPLVVFALVVLALSRSALSGFPLPFPYPLSLLYSGWVAWYAVAQYCLIFVIEALFMTWIAALAHRIPSQPTERQWRTVKGLAAASIAGIAFTMLGRIVPNLSDSGVGPFVPRWYLDFVDSPWAVLDYFAAPLHGLARAAVVMLIGLIVWSRVRLPATPPPVYADQDQDAPTRAEQENA